MTMQQAKSIEEITILDAVARKVRVDLVLKPVTVRTDTRLISRFLGLQANDALVLEVPCTRDRKKVFLPVGWQLGMAFELRHLWFQARTQVLDHCFFPLYPGWCVDGLVVDRPEKFQTRKRRDTARHEVDPSKHAVATLWPCVNGQVPNTSRPDSGLVVDYSKGGLGIKTSSPLSLQIGSQAVIRIQTLQRMDCVILRGTLKYCTPSDDGFCRAGFGDVVEIVPGESHSIIEFLAAPPKAHLDESSP